MEPTIYKPSIYNEAGVYKCQGIYNGETVYNDGLGETVEIGGRTYKAVTINGITWLAQNLDYKFCTIGGSGTPSNPHAWYYDNDEPTYSLDGLRKCGLLYNWYAVKYLNDNRSDLIPGWHVPTRTEWVALNNAVGGTSVAGKKLKAANVSWAPSWGGEDEFGFSVLPGGYYNGNFTLIGTYGAFFTIEQYSSASSYIRDFNEGASSDSNLGWKKSGYYVRLVKDI